MSPRNSDRGPASTPPTMDIYTGLLAVATVALVIGCTLMFLVLKNQYGFALPN